MPHCSLDEAWGYTYKKKQDHSSEPVSQSPQKEVQVVEPFCSTKNCSEYQPVHRHSHSRYNRPVTVKPRKQYKNVQELNSEFSEMDLDSEEYINPCDEFMTHFRKCAKCRRKIRRLFKNLVTAKVEKTEHKQIPDSFYYMLIGMFIILVLDALIRLSRILGPRK